MAVAGQRIAARRAGGRGFALVTVFGHVGYFRRLPSGASSWQIPFLFHGLNFCRTKSPIIVRTDTRIVARGAAMSGKWQAEEGTPSRGRRRLCVGLAVAAAAAVLTACAGGNSEFFSNTPPPETAHRRPAATLGQGQVRVGLILPLSAQGNAGVAATSMKNAADLALAEFKNPNIQLLVKDDGGTPQGAQAAAQQAISEGAEIIIGPLFAEAVRAAGATARQRGIPVIAFSTDVSVASHGIYLLSFLPETDVKRIVDYAVSRGKRSFAAMLPDSAYGAVVEAAFQQEVARRGGRILALEKYPHDAGQDGRAGAARGAGGFACRFDFHSRWRRRGAASRAGAWRGGRQYEARAAARHRPVG